MSPKTRGLGGPLIYLYYRQEYYTIGIVFLAQKGRLKDPPIRSSLEMKGIGELEEFSVNGTVIQWKHSKVNPSTDLLLHAPTKMYTVADRIHGRHISSDGVTDTYEYTPGQLDKETAIKYTKKYLRGDVYFCVASNHPSFPTPHIFRDILRGVHATRPVIVFPSILNTLSLLTKRDWKQVGSTFTSVSDVVEASDIIRFISPLIQQWYVSWLGSPLTNRFRVKLIRGEVTNIQRQIQNYIRALLKKPLKLTPTGKTIIIRTRRKK